MSKSTKKVVQEAPKPLTMRDVLIEAVQVETSIEDLRAEVKNLAGGVSEHLLTVAKGFRNVTAFLSACEIDERWIKSDEAGTNKVDKLPRCWTQAKSNIKQAFKFNMDLSSYKNEFNMRTDLNKKREEAKGTTGGEKAQAALKDVIDTSKDPRISQSLEALIATLMTLEGDEALDRAVEGMNKLTTDLKVFAALVPEKPVIVQEGTKATTA